MTFKNWKVRTKIWTAFSIAMLLLTALSAVTYVRFEAMQSSQKWVDHTRNVLHKMTLLRDGVQRALIAERGYVITGREANLERFKRATVEVGTHYQTLLELTADNPAQQSRLQVLRGTIDETLGLFRQVIEARSGDGGEVAAKELVGADSGFSALDRLKQQMAELVEAETQLLNQRRSEDASTVAQTKALLLVSVITGILLYALIAFHLSRDIARPLVEVAAAARRIAARELNTHVPSLRRHDEIGEVNEAFASMVLTLSELVDAAERIAEGDLTVAVVPASERDKVGRAFFNMVNRLKELARENQEAIGALRESASEFVATASELAAGAAQTATSVNETTTTVVQVRQAAEMVSHKVKSVADNAQQMVKTSQNGMRAVDDVVEGMSTIRTQMESLGESIVRLSDQSLAIGEIIASVNDLAEQSKLLAVNAAMEAAKAGEAGKGFAVVANEVKALAAQSKDATTRVRHILTDIQKSMNTAVMLTEQGNRAVQIGSKQTAEAGAAIETLGKSISDAAGAAVQIAASTQQQMVGMQQIAQAMESVKAAGTQNSAAAKQTENAAQGLSAIGEKLQHLVSHYRL